MARNNAMAARPALGIARIATALAPYSLTVLRVRNEVWSVVSLNDMAHLEAEHEPNLVSAPPDDAEPPQSL